MKATIKWLSQNVLIGKRAFLFCFGERCMSGKIKELKKLNAADEFEIWVEFIEPDFFKQELINSNGFTINEASKVLGKGKVKL